MTLPKIVPYFLWPSTTDCHIFGSPSTDSLPSPQKIEIPQYVSSQRIGTKHTYNHRLANAIFNMFHR